MKHGWSVFPDPIESAHPAGEIRYSTRNWAPGPPGAQHEGGFIHTYLDEATRDIITRGVHQDLSEAAENPGLPGGGDP